MTYRGNKGRPVRQIVPQIARRQLPVWLSMFYLSRFVSHREPANSLRTITITIDFLLRLSPMSNAMLEIQPMYLVNLFAICLFSDSYTPERMACSTFRWKDLSHFCERTAICDLENCSSRLYIHVYFFLRSLKSVWNSVVTCSVFSEYEGQSIYF